jgi:[acyl-carrier-protein] S-malonyltransferase
LGPGTALARMWRVRHPRIPVRSLEDFRDAAGAAAWLTRDTA